MTAFGEYSSDETASTMKARDCKDATDLVVHGTQDPCVQVDRAFALGRNNGAENAVLPGLRVRRLTPIECERLQGFPDNHTRIPYRNKPAEECSAGPRYMACGNSKAVPAVRFVGLRLIGEWLRCAM